MLRLLFEDGVGSIKVNDIVSVHKISRTLSGQMVLTMSHFMYINAEK